MFAVEQEVISTSPSLAQGARSAGILETVFDHSDRVVSAASALYRVKKNR